MFSSISIKDTKLAIGELIKMLRKQQKLSQEELANKMGVSRITIQNLEAGNNATVDTMLKAFRQFELLEQFSAFLKDKKSDQVYPSLY